MYVYVVLEYSPRCPRCKVAERTLRNICESLGVPLILRRVGSEGAVGRDRFAYHPTSIQHTFTEDFAERVGDIEVKKVIQDLKRFGIDPSRFTSTPVIRIVFGGNRGEREIVIRGFPLDRESLRQTYINLYQTLKILAGGRK